MVCLNSGEMPKLWKLCNEYRGHIRKKVEQYHHIEQIVINTRRDKIWNDNSSRKRRKVCNNVEEVQEKREK